MLSLFQCFNDNESDEVLNSLIRSSNTTTESNNSNSNSINDNKRNVKIYIEISIGSVEFDVLIDRKGIKFADVINEALNVYIANTNTTRKNIVIKGIILNDNKNIININSIRNDIVTINARKAKVLIEFRYTISVFTTTNVMKSIFKFLHQSPHQLTQLLKCSKTMNMLLDTDEYWKNIDLNDSFCRVNDKTWITLRIEHGLPFKNLLRIRHTNLYSCRLKVFYGNLRQAKQSKFSSFSCLDLPEDYGIILKKNLVLMIGQGSNTLCQQIHFYISNAIPISGKSQVVFQYPVFRGGEVVDMDYRNGNIVQIESIPRQQGNRWLLRRSGDGRLTFIQVDHIDNSHPKNNEAMIFQKDSILDRVNSFILVIEYNQIDDGKVELFLESVYKNYISIWSSSQLSSLENLERPSPILIMIGIQKASAISFLDQYVDTIVIKIRRIMENIIAKDNMKNIFANRVILYQVHLLLLYKHHANNSYRHSILMQ